MVTLSDSEGYIYDPKGIDAGKLAFVMQLKNVKRGRIKEYCDKYPEATFVAGKRPWEVKCDIALPSATQNEINVEDALTPITAARLGGAGRGHRRDRGAGPRQAAALRNRNDGR